LFCSFWGFLLFLVSFLLSMYFYVLFNSQHDNWILLLLPISWSKVNMLGNVWHYHHPSCQLIMSVGMLWLLVTSIHVDVMIMDHMSDCYYWIDHSFSLNIALLFHICWYCCTWISPTSRPGQQSLSPISYCQVPCILDWRFHWGKRSFSA
jgi:hypothetical protein